MSSTRKALLASAFTMLPLCASPLIHADGTPALYVQHCAQCHGADRLGLMGPALLPENLTRVRKTEAARVIAEGRPATQMPALGAVLDKAAIERLVEYIYTPLPTVPAWDVEQIEASRKVPVATADLVKAPVHDADPMNMFIVVELGDHHASVLDGDRMVPIHRFKTQYAVHGGPKIIHRTDASCISCRATAGSASSTCGACRRWSRYAPGSMPAISQCRTMDAT